jgi:predicted Zn-dependent protease
MRRCGYVLVGVALVASAQQGQSVNFYSLDGEAAMGKKLAKAMDSKTTQLHNDAASAYVDRVVQGLAVQIPGSKFHYVVTIVKDDLGTEPVVLAGGHIYIPAFFFTAAQSESEFVGLLAHSMAHVADRDATRGATSDAIIQRQGSMAQDGGGSNPAHGVFLRAYELQADWVAVKTIAAAGYDPGDLARYVERDGKSDGLPGWKEFQKKRLASLRKDAAGVRVAPSSDGLEFKRVRDSVGK